MARPPRVAIRARKPCVFARFRLFGWYVRFTWVPSLQPQGNRVARAASPAIIPTPDEECQTSCGVVWCAWFPQPSLN